MNKTHVAVDIFETDSLLALIKEQSYLGILNY